HWTAVKNILKYLRNTKDMFLVYGGNPEAELRVDCYCNAVFEIDIDDMKSLTGYCPKALEHAPSMTLPSGVIGVFGYRVSGITVWVGLVFISACSPSGREGLILETKGLIVAYVQNSPPTFARTPVIASVGSNTLLEGVEKDCSIKSQNIADIIALISKVSVLRDAMSNLMVA
ncbi:hypothetical protein Tco_0583989, partial [Tanacetum coccineum]